MVDLENLIKVSNSGQFPNLLTTSDVDNIKEIGETHNLLPSRIGIWKTDPTEPTKYGFESTVPGGVEQYQLPSGRIIDNKLFKYLIHEKGVYYEAGKPDTPITEYMFVEPVPLFSATIESLCQLAQDVSGNSNTSKLRELLNLLEEVQSDITDYELNTIIISEPNKSLKVGLIKVSNALVPTDVFKFLGTRSNTKLYQALQSASDLTSEILLDQYNNVEIFVEFNSTGLVKELGWALAPRFLKNDKPYDDDILGKEQLHIDTVSKIKDGMWMPELWKDEISAWENHSHDAVCGLNILTATAEGFKTEILYGY